MNAASVERRDTEEVKRVGGDTDTLKAFGSLASSVEYVQIINTNGFGEGTGLAAEFQKLRGSVSATAPRLTPLQVVNLHGNNMLSVAVRKRFK